MPVRHMQAQGLPQELSLLHRQSLHFPELGAQPGTPIGSNSHCHSGTGRPSQLGASNSNDRRRSSVINVSSPLVCSILISLNQLCSLHFSYSKCDSDLVYSPEKRALPTDWRPTFNTLMVVIFWDDAWAGAHGRTWEQRPAEALGNPLRPPHHGEAGGGSRGPGTHKRPKHHQECRRRDHQPASTSGIVLTHRSHPR